MAPATPLARLAVGQPDQEMKSVPQASLTSIDLIRTTSDIACEYTAQ